MVETVEAILLTFKLALISTLILLFIGVPLAWYLAHLKSKFKPLWEALIALPFVLPPVVLGFYLLILFSPQSGLGKLWLQLTGHTLAFSFTGLVVGSVIYSLPFVVQPLIKAFEYFDLNLLAVAKLMGAGPLDRFLTVILPMNFSAIFTAFCLGFTHTLGEFGVALMIGGNIPGQTRVISISLYEAVELQQFNQAHVLALTLLGFSVVALLIIYGLSYRYGHRHHER